MGWEGPSRPTFLYDSYNPKYTPVMHSACQACNNSRFCSLDDFVIRYSKPVWSQEYILCSERSSVCTLFIHLFMYSIHIHNLNFALVNFYFIMTLAYGLGTEFGEE